MAETYTFGVESIGRRVHTYAGRMRTDNLDTRFAFCHIGDIVDELIYPLDVFVSRSGC